MMMMVLTGCTTVTNINPRYPRVDSTVQRSCKIVSELNIPYTVSGTNTILELGITRYSGHPLSTAHGDFDKLFFVLPGNIKQDETFICSTKEDSLFYWGFSGYDSWKRADPSNTRATIQIEAVGDQHIVAHVELSFKVVHLNNPRSIWNRRIIEINDVFLFKNEK